MTSPIPLRLPQKAIAASSPRLAAIASATLLLSNLTAVVAWLLKHGIFITGFKGWRGEGIDRVVVTVAASPLLYEIFRSRCAWRERRQDGALTIYTWFADRAGVRVEWEEVCA